MAAFPGMIDNAVHGSKRPRSPHDTARMPNDSSSIDHRWSAAIIVERSGATDRRQVREYTAAEAPRESGIAAAVLRTRLYPDWPFLEALTQPLLPETDRPCSPSARPAEWLGRPCLVVAESIMVAWL
jgi:hypothetical protein